MNAAPLIPSALVGPVIGAVVDRWRRRPALIAASIGRAITLGVVPVLWVLGLLSIPALVVLLLLFGLCSVLGFAATQSLLPRLVARERLVLANARIDQGDAAAGALGPVIRGGLVGLLGAPLAIVIDAVSYLVDAVLIASVRVEEPRRPRPAGSLRAEIAEGARWGYRHRTLGPLAASTHVWFVANAAALTILSILCLRTLQFTAVQFGLLLTVNAIATLIGAACAPAIGRRLGSGRTIIVGRGLYPVAWLVIALSSSGPVGTGALFVAIAIQGVAAGLENAHEMSIRQTVTPDELLGRVNATMRSANRAAAVIGALAAGAVVGVAGVRVPLLGVAVLFAAAFVVAVASPLRSADPA